MSFRNEPTKDAAPAEEEQEAPKEAAKQEPQGEEPPREEPQGDTPVHEQNASEDQTQEPNDMQAAESEEPESAKEGESAQREHGMGERYGRRPGRTDGAPAETDEGGNPMEALNLKDVEMKDIIQKIAEWTGKVVIPADEVMGQKITVYSPKELPRSQALSVIFSALRTKGFVPEYVEEMIYIKPIAKARLGSVPTLGADEPLARVQDKEAIVEKFFRLNNYSPSKMVEMLTPLTADYGHVTAIESTGTVAVIDTVENLMRIERIIQQLDTPESGREVERIFELQYADPGEIVQVLNLLLVDSQSRRSPSSRGGGRPQQPPQPGKEQGQATSVVLDADTVPIKLLSMPKQKWIIARASAEDMERIAEWIAKLDIEETREAEKTVVQVQYLEVDEVVRIVRRTLMELPGSQLKMNVAIEGLPASRQVVIFGSDENRMRIESLIAEIDLPSQDIYETRTFNLKYADPDQIKQNIENLYTEQQDQGSRFSYYSYRYRQQTKPEDVVRVISYPTTGQVTVIAVPEKLDDIERQITEEWDTPLDTDKQQYRILSLQNSDAVKMSNLLTKMFSEESTQGRNPWWWYFEGGSDAKKKIVGSLYGLLTFEPVPDTKKIIVISKIPEAYDIVENLVRELDRQEMAEVPRVITLNYADAEALCDQLNAILNEPGTPATVQRYQRGLSDVSYTSMDTGSTGQSSNRDSDQAQAGAITPWWDRARQRSDEQPASNLIGKVRFIPVHRSKAILVLAPPEYIDEITSLVEQLDKPGKQVMIKAIVVEVNHSNVTSLGVQLASNPAAFGPLEENAIQVVNALSYAEEFGSVSMTANLNANVLVDLLIKRANAKILNQPTLWTKDNEEATFFKGQQVAFIVSDQSDSTNTNNIRRSFEYRNVGLTLQVRPNITPEKAVDITIKVIISQVEPDLINDQIATNELETTTHMIVDDSQTILLGGILFQNDSVIKRRLPIIGQIPVADWIFSHTDSQLVNNELLIFITPYVYDETTTDKAREQLDEPMLKMESILDELKTRFMQEE